MGWDESLLAERERFLGKLIVAVAVAAAAAATVAAVKEAAK